MRGPFGPERGRQAGPFPSQVVEGDDRVRVVGPAQPPAHLLAEGRPRGELLGGRWPEREALGRGGGDVVRHASITNGGLAYIEYQLPVRSGSNVTLTLEYYNANRAGAVTPGLKLELLNSTRVIAPPANPVMAAVTGLRGYAPDGRIRFYIEFPTTVGLTYYVQYKDAVGVPWKTSPVVINGTGNRLNWLDDGAPNTDSPPSAGRFYRVITGN